ncbi:unnamed protein product [Callosobruchus maculatus]|uniref:Uncharacterized protein n=1 Tax=Callosobruchus maculatus TaxID=64391 RepID=A0A653DIB1_CALMS|nr:unnamed protein product [Callosobruchus maculatus]
MTRIRRLLVQISFNNIALTGCRMFKITRGIVLSVSFKFSVIWYLYRKINRVRSAYNVSIVFDFTYLIY